MRIEAYRPEHLALLELRPLDARAFEGFGDMDKWMDNYVSCGPVYTGIDEDVVVFIMGICMLWPGLGEGWVLTSSHVERLRLGFHKAVKGFIEMARKDFHLHRLQVNILAEHKQSCRWIERLGFGSEGVMKAFGPKRQDFVRYARIW